MTIEPFVQMKIESWIKAKVMAMYDNVRINSMSTLCVIPHKYSINSYAFWSSMYMYKLDISKQQRQVHFHGALDWKFEKNLAVKTFWSFNFVLCFQIPSRGWKVQCEMWIYLSLHTSVRKWVKGNRSSKKPQSCPKVGWPMYMNPYQSCQVWFSIFSILTSKNQYFHRIKEYEPCAKHHRCIGR